MSTKEGMIPTNSCRRLYVGFVVFVTLCVTVRVLWDPIYVLTNEGLYDLGDKSVSRYNPVVWSGQEEGVIDCRTGEVLRPLPRTDQDLYEPINISSVIKSSVRETDEERKRSFVRIYEEKRWGGQRAPNPAKGAIYGSGSGSTLYNTVNVRKTLHSVIENIKIILGKSRISMLDIPCGDLTWMSVFMSNRSDVIYDGMDIVPDVITHHTRVFTPRYRHMRFLNQDIVSKPLTRKYDLIFTREMTQHLTSSETFRVLRHLQESGSYFLLATTVPDVSEKELDMTSYGRFRDQNLETSPFNLPAPLCISQDKGKEFNALWCITRP